MNKLNELFSVVNLAEIPPQMEGRQLGFIKGEKGETAYLNIPDASRTVMVFELLEDKPRGNHYHRLKEEYIYVIEGHAKVYIWLPDCEDEPYCIDLRKSDWMHIRPGLAHLYVGAPRALILEQSPIIYDAEHTVICHLQENIDGRS
ncbi:MAG: hypothetical protein Q7V63_00130 [Gammaproteobacteria bacterium]|nr:hypothetical protein [Gammaproteobacteria bacterium]